MHQSINLDKNQLDIIEMQIKLTIDSIAQGSDTSEGLLHHTVSPIRIV
jgi:hypothetical protein